MAANARGQPALLLLTNLLAASGHAIGARMEGDLQAAISATVARAPEWMRQDLLSKDVVVRSRAEETLSAMIANAISETIQK